MYILTLSLPLPLPQSLSHNTLSHSVAPAYDVGGLGGRTQVRTEAKTHAQTEDTQTHTHTCRVSVSSSRPNQTTTRWRRRPHAVKGKSKLKSVIRFGPNSCCRRYCRRQSQLRQRVRSLHLTCVHIVLTANVNTLLKLHCTVNTVAAGCAVHCRGGGRKFFSLNCYTFFAIIF